MALYVPQPRVPLRDWCEWTGNSWDKVQAVVGRSFRRPAPYEDAYTMAATAVLRLIRNYRLDPRRIGQLALGTESSKDNSAGAVIVRGMVDRELERQGLPRLSRQLEVPEFKHACLGGIYALKSALRYAAFDAEGRQAIVVCSDIAEYERGSTGEQTQGAGAVAMLVEAEPKLFEVDLAHAGSASDYRGPDFRKPFARHFDHEYAERGKRLHDFPIFSGKYSTFAYLDETGQAFDAMIERLGISDIDFLASVRGMFFHRPYHMMPLQALAFIYARALARAPQPHAEFQALCEQAGVPAEGVRDECRNEPDLFGEFLRLGGHAEAAQEPHPLTTKLAGMVRKSPAFQQLLATRVHLGTDWAMELGNLYTAALPAWIAAGFEQALAQDTELANAQLVAIGYGSGDAAESVPLKVVPAWREAAAKINFRSALAASVDLSQHQYEALHDGKHVELDCPARDQFVIARTGDTYETSFQDLGVDYYEFAQ
ncbi:hydroxymethylglutaryl-CoA synthase [Dyella jejuensis]|uniref:Hydroxymethylglutaryl-CoA synthase n=2 Tax=Dyella jejuensis TaxID=1432009 RepID=A0ABW8JFV2_9GAMM